MDGPYPEGVEGGGGMIFAPSLHECQQFEQHIHFLNQNAVIPHEKKKVPNITSYIPAATPICYVFSPTFEDYLCKVAIS